MGPSTIIYKDIFLVKERDQVQRSHLFGKRSYRVLLTSEGVAYEYN
jgi:hypothetical protein